jgi:hypothetical protein
MKLRLGLLDDNVTDNADQLPAWSQPLQTLSGILGLQLRVEWVDTISRLRHPCISQWLKQHGHIISHITAGIHVSEELKLRDFSKAAACCKSIDLTVSHSSTQLIYLADLDPVAGSLWSLDCRPSVGSGWCGRVGGGSAFNSMSQLTALNLTLEHLGNEEPWAVLGKLTSLQQLELNVGASGDPSPLSALTGLTCLILNSLGRVETRFSFDSLQPLSTLQQLERLHLVSHACAATSLQGLAGLSSLKRLEVRLPPNGGQLRSLEGISHGLVDVSVSFAPELVSLAGIQSCTRIEKLYVFDCGVSSLQHLGCLSSLKQLVVSECDLTSLEGLPSRSLQDLSLSGCSSITQLSGAEHLTALTSLELVCCGVTSLQPLSLSRQGLQKLVVHQCESVQEEVLELPHTLPTLDVVVTCSNVKAVVLAGGVRRVVQTPLHGALDYKDILG